MKLKAVVTTEFTGRPDGESLPRLIAVGETIHGDLARSALDSGNAAEAETEGRKARPARKQPRRRTR